MSKVPVGGIEAGGTKFNCVVACSPTEILARLTIPTISPDDTLSRSLDFFESAANKHGCIEALGIGSFGPIDLDPASAQYGHITATPKAGWQNTDILGYFQRKLRIPVCIDTDVNAAALAEYCFGAGNGLANLVYVTVGTGIGAGVIAKGQPLNPTHPPEIGHMRLPRHEADEFLGCCPYHNDCLEGLASGPAIEQRWGINAASLPPEHFAWTLQADYLAKLCTNIACCFAPQRIILGGGVMTQLHLFPRIRERFLYLMNGYMPSVDSDNVGHYIVAPELQRPGEIGALQLATMSQSV